MIFFDKPALTEPDPSLKGAYMGNCASDTTNFVKRAEGYDICFPTLGAIPGIAAADSHVSRFRSAHENFLLIFAGVAFAFLFLFVSHSEQIFSSPKSKNVISAKSTRAEE